MLFAALFNRALYLLHNIERAVEHVYPASELNILAARNDALPMAEQALQDDGARATQHRAPGVVITSRRAAQAHYAGDIERWDYLSILGTWPPSMSNSSLGAASVKQLFSWSDALGVASVVCPEPAPAMKGPKRTKANDENIGTSTDLCLVYAMLNSDSCTRSAPA